MSATAAFADNPIVQTSYTADPAPMVYDGRLYLYTSHDEDVTVNNFFTMNDWRLYSTTDMVNWTDHGSPAGYKTFSWGTGDAWAPMGVARNGKFYLYVPINNSTGSKIGVAVASNPWGPFTDPLGKALISTGSGNIDPTVFIDDDGQAYLYWGNPDLYYVKLNADMTSFTGGTTKVSLTTAGFGTRSDTTRATAYEEGPWFYKRGSLYYIVYPADGTPEKISYTTSSGPLGPWMYRGDIMAKETGSGSSFTNHPGIIDYKGKSFFFYHNAALPGGGGYKRSVCVEEFTYGTDGSIPMIKMTTAGPAPVDTLNPYQQVEAETIAFSSGLKTEVCTDTGAGMNVTSISNGDYIKVKNLDFGEGPTAFDARVSGAGSNAKIELHLDSQTGTSLGTCDVSGASMWTTKSCTVSGTTGKHDLFLKFTGGSGDLFKFNWWKFTPKNPTMDGGTPDGGGMDGGSGGAGAGGMGGRPSGSGGATDAGVGDAGSGGTKAGSGGTSGGTGGQAMGTGGGSGGAQAGSGGTGGQTATGSGGKTSASGGSGGVAAGTGGANIGSGGQGSGGVSGASGGSGSNATGGDSGCACQTAAHQSNSLG
ncbi:MAG TPA: glycoside hydrolase family 43 protein, partial [Polyangia bacterium]|nr:glycoside hydrolase family 43 protein [Polyangia bacterium]